MGWCEAVFDIYDLAMITSNIFTAYIVKRLFSVFFEKSRNKSISFLTYTLYCIVISVSSIVFDIPILNMITTIIMLLIISFTYEATISKRLVVTSLYIVISLAVEIIVYTVSFRGGSSPIGPIEYQSVLGLFICKMILFLLVLLTEKAGIHRSNVKTPISFFIAAVTTPLLSIVIGIIITDIDGISKAVLISAICMLMIINITTFALYDALSYYYEQQIENVMLKNELMYYNNQFLLMKKSVEDMRSFKHDINNHLLAVLSYLKDGNRPQAVSYIDTIIKSEKAITHNYVDTGNVVIDSILNYKLSSLEETNAKLDIKALMPYDLPVDDGYFVVILSNLVDNAIEAVMQCPDTVEKSLKIDVSYKKGVLRLTIKNSYDGTLLGTDDQFVTRKASDNHGFGLCNVRKAVDKYNGVMEIDHTDSVFTVNVLLYVS